MPAIFRRSYHTSYMVKVSLDIYNWNFGVPRFNILLEIWRLPGIFGSSYPIPYGQILVGHLQLKFLVFLGLTACWNLELAGNLWVFLGILSHMVKISSDIYSWDFWCSLV